MEFFTEEHEMFRQSLRTFLEKEVRPYLDEWEEAGRIPREVWRKMGDLGFLGLSYPEKYGGSGLDFFYEVVFNEELGRMNSGGFIITQQVVQYMSSPYVLKYGSEELRQKYLPGIVSGENISCVGITEPGAGSDVKNICSRAVREGDFYVVNGSKTFITNGVYADFIVAAVKTDPGAGTKGISLLVIDLDSEGVACTKLDKLGWRASDTAEISFDDVRVPAKNLLGEEGKGFGYLMNGLQLERICFFPSGVTAMESALAEALRYMAERKAFGKNIDRFQVLRHRVAQMSSEIVALKAYGYGCCRQYDEGIHDTLSCSVAKLLSTELHQKVAAECLHFFGGYGFMEDYPLARMYRDVKVGTIGGGTSEIMREIIGGIAIDGARYGGVPALGLKPAADSSQGEREVFRGELRALLKKEAAALFGRGENPGEVPEGLCAQAGKPVAEMDIPYRAIVCEEAAKINAGRFAGNGGFRFSLRAGATENSVEGRLSAAVAATAVAGQALALTIGKMNENTAFGKTAGKFQSLRHLVAQLFSELECQKGFVEALCAQLAKSLRPSALEAAMAKLLALQLRNKAVFECMQIFGEHGFAKEYPAAKLWADLCFGQVGRDGSGLLLDEVAAAVIDGKTG